MSRHLDAAECEAIAATIWRQISVGTKMACGAREALAINRGLLFTVGRAMTRVRVLLTPADLYEVSLIKLKRGTGEARIVEARDDKYAEDLSETIYHMVNK